MIVARQRTPYPLGDLLGLLDATGHEVLVTCPGPDRLSVAWAQLVLEHGVSPPEAGAARANPGGRTVEHVETKGERKRSRRERKAAR